MRAKPQSCVLLVMLLPLACERATPSPPAPTIAAASKPAATMPHWNGFFGDAVDTWKLHYARDTTGQEYLTLPSSWDKRPAAVFVRPSSAATQPAMDGTWGAGIAEDIQRLTSRTRQLRLEADGRARFVHLDSSPPDTVRCWFLEGTWKALGDNVVEITWTRRDGWHAV